MELGLITIPCHGIVINHGFIVMNHYKEEIVKVALNKTDHRVWGFEGPEAHLTYELCWVDALPSFYRGGSGDPERLSDLLKATQGVAGLGLSPDPRLGHPRDLYVQLYGTVTAWWGS